jgi:hypothetical protein
MKLLAVNVGQPRLNPWKTVKLLPRLLAAGALPRELRELARRRTA